MCAVEEPEFDPVTGVPLNKAAQTIRAHETPEAELAEFDEFTGVVRNEAAKQLAVMDDFPGVKLALFNTDSGDPLNDAAQRIFDGVVLARHGHLRPEFDEFTGEAVNYAARNVVLSRDRNRPEFDEMTGEAVNYAARQMQLREQHAAEEPQRAVARAAEARDLARARGVVAEISFW